MTQDFQSRPPILVAPYLGKYPLQLVIGENLLFSRVSNFLHYWARRTHLFSVFFVTTSYPLLTCVTLLNGSTKTPLLHIDVLANVETKGK